MAMHDAYWISPNGQIDSVPTSHIAAIISSPEHFGTTLKEIHEAYTRFNEKLGVEGKAREEIMKKVIARGFIRIRNTGNAGYSITLQSLDDHTSGMLRQWARALSSDGIDGIVVRDVHTHLNILALGNHKRTEYGFTELVTTNPIENHEK